MQPAGRALSSFSKVTVYRSAAREVFRAYAEDLAEQRRVRAGSEPDAKNMGQRCWQVRC
jgi:hypothetical protein